MLIILTGESGSGKSTIERMIEGKGYNRIISYTTREPRGEEVDGTSYKFITRKKFFELYDLNFFGEYTCYNGNYYGAAVSDLYKQNSVGVFEPNGYRQIKANKEINSLIFYIHVDEEVRKRRMIKRGDNLDKIENRIGKDKKIFKNTVIESDYIIINDNINDTIKEIISIVKKNI